MLVKKDTDNVAQSKPSAEPHAFPPSISLPKGGGAIRGMGEKFAANPVTGTGSMSVPIATSPGRSGFGPQLSLSYDSGAGNGPFGFGWSLSLPSITRKTDKGLPQYLDAIDSDVFILSGAEDLVPVYRQDPDGTWIAGHPGFQRDADGFWVRDPSGRLVVREDELDGHRVRRYRPRIEGLFARIERWSKIGSPSDVHWRSISKDNILTLYGHDANSRIADPLDASRIFSWLICESRDDKGNGIRYLYKKEDGAYQLRPGQADPFKQAHQLNRGDTSDPRRTAQRYLQRVLYGNIKPLLDVQGQRPRRLSDLPNPSTDTSVDWLFEVRFDYGELDENDPMGQPEKPWFHRPDAFSSYRSGFEVRTCRRCERVLMLHHIPDQPAGPGRAAQPGYRGVVRSTEFTYDDELDPRLATRPVYSFLKQVVQTGWKQQDGSTTRRSLPPVEFEYTEPIVQDAIEEVDPRSLENLPVGLDGSAYRWTDLHGEGIPGILTEQAGTWFYKRNLSPLAGTAKFAPLETVALKPNVALSSGAEFMDLAGDGQPDVVVMEGPTPGLYEHDEAEGWQPFRPFTSRLNRNLRDPNLKFIDLDGDGHADVLISEDNAFVWHASLAEEGFGPARRVARALDEEKGPRIIFADGTQSIHLADLSGDGLTDIVRIRNGEVCYWPNLGYGRFGAKVTMDHAPWFDHPDQFDYKRIRLADIDGSGTTDVIYLHRDGVRLYFNQSGNGWGPPQVLKVFPRIDDLVSIVPTDLLGNGTACLVWSSPLAGDARRPMRYVNLMGSGKPHLLVRTINNLGAETRVDYAPLTKFYLQDKRDGTPWITRLPFPVHVVERVETYDWISRNRFVTRYAYHHGYFDGVEREFRGFGKVEQWDTEEFGTLTASGQFPAATNIDAASNVPPVRTVTWFHTGAFIGEGQITKHFEEEYYREGDASEALAGLSDAQLEAMLLPDTLLPATVFLPDGTRVAYDLTGEERREACRALRGSILRQEIYAEDDSEATDRPYTASERNYTLELLQPQGPNRYAVFFAHARESVEFHYERRLYPVSGNTLADPKSPPPGVQTAADPRVTHELILASDAFGNVLQTVAVAYGRRYLDPALVAGDQAKQSATLVTYKESSYTNPVLADDAYRAPAAAEASAYELIQAQPASALPHLTNLFRFEELQSIVKAASDGAHDVPFENLNPTGLAAAQPYRRLIRRQRTLYRPDDMGTGAGNAHALLPLGTLQSLALAGERYRLALTPGLVSQVYQRGGNALMAAPATVIAGTGPDGGGYVDLDGDGNGWMPSGRAFDHPDPNTTPAQELAEAQQHFFLPRRFEDPFGNSTTVTYDPPHDLLVIQSADALANTLTAVNDYRVLKPTRLTDPNGNRTAVAFDALGMVAGTAVMGKASENLGDSLTGFTADLTAGQIDTFYLAADPHTPAEALLNSATTRIVYDLDRFRRTWQAHPNDPRTWQPACAATLARETHVNSPLPPQGLKIQLSFSYSDGFGHEIQKKIQAEPGPVDVNDPQAPVVNPRWVGSGWTIFNNKGKPVRQYEPFFSATHDYEFGAMVGVSPVLFYDPAERVIATLHPNHTYEKGVFDPWQQTTYDVNDTCAARNAQTGDPRTDPDIGGFVAEYFKTQPIAWQTWHAQRIGGALGAHEQKAAERAAAHADTPTTAHFDALGRPFLTVARNRVVCPGHDLDGSEESLATRVELDIEGNQRAVRDAIQQAGDPLGRVVMRYAYDMLGNRIYQLSMEAGARWMLNDVAGKPIRAWDSRGHNFTTTYDALRRPVKQTVRGTTADSDPRTLNRDTLVDKIEYGEALANAEALNLRTRIYRHFDSADVATNARLDANGNPLEAYDFKGNLLRSTRRLVSDYTAIPDWLLNPQLNAEVFEGSTRYDALNRPIQSVAPHSSLTRPEHPNKFNIIQPVFNEANLLERVDVWLERVAEPAALLDPAADAASPVGVANVDYDAKGQRLRIDYKNGASTFYRHDPLTFRLTQLLTQRKAADFPGDDPQPPIAGWPGQQAQNLRYTYDPAGNITHIQDDTQQTVYFKNKRVEPSNDYVYDALYQLIQATGREHLGQGGAPIAPSHDDAERIGLLHPGDGNAMGTYIERYVYDAVGNFLAMQHRGNDPANAGWTRAYDYLEPSLIEDGNGGAPLKASNRLTRTTLNPTGNTPQPETYLHDAHGNMLRMPHLGGGLPGPNMHWDYKDRLRQTDLGGGGMAYYVYDASGQRVRKVWAKAQGLTEERIYLGGFEVFLRHGGAIGANSATLERETLHVMDDKQRIALVETRTLDTAGDDPAPRQLIRYQFGNHLGSASLELDEQAQIISYEEYAPYGSSTYQAVRSQTETAKRYRYTGKERDEESGLYYHGARYYAAPLGRWTACDPIGIGDGANLFYYVSGNPIKFRDDFGTAGDDPLKNLTLDPGKTEYWQGKELHLNIAEPMTVGEKGIPNAVARVRALDVNNREFLGMVTNQKTQGRGVPMNPLQPARQPISVSENPSALITRRFSEITEMQTIFNDAVASIKNAASLTATALKNAINSKVWNIIRNGNSAEAVRVRAAFASIGAQDIPGQGIGWLLRLRIRQLQFQEYLRVAGNLARNRRNHPSKCQHPRRLLNHLRPDVWPVRRPGQPRWSPRPRKLSVRCSR